MTAKRKHGKGRSKPLGRPRGQYIAQGAVQARLDELGWVQADVAAYLQVSPQYVNMVLRGHKRLAPPMARRWAQLLHMGLDNLLAAR